MEGLRKTERRERERRDKRTPFALFARSSYLVSVNPMRDLVVALDGHIGRHGLSVDGDSSRCNRSELNRRDKRCILLSFLSSMATISLFSLVVLSSSCLV